MNVEMHTHTLSVHHHQGHSSSADVWSGVGFTTVVIAVPQLHNNNNQ